MVDRLAQAVEALERIAAVLGAECSPHSPGPERDVDAKGAWNATHKTTYDGTKAAPQNLAAATQDTLENTEGHMIVCTKILDDTGAELPNALLGVYFAPPQGKNAAIPLSRGGWIKRRRGFQEFWVVNLRPDLGQAFPVLTVVEDPGVELGDIGGAGIVPGETVMLALSRSSADVQQIVAGATAFLADVQLTVPVGGDGTWMIWFNADLSGDPNNESPIYGATQLYINGVAVPGFLTYNFFSLGMDDADLAVNGPVVLPVTGCYMAVGLAAGDTIDLAVQAGNGPPGTTNGLIAAPMTLMALRVAL